MECSFRGRLLGHPSVCARIAAVLCLHAARSPLSPHSLLSARLVSELLFYQDHTPTAFGPTPRTSL